MFHLSSPAVTYYRTVTPVPADKREERSKGRLIWLRYFPLGELILAGIWCRTDGRIGGHILNAAPAVTFGCAVEPNAPRKQF